MTTRNEATTGNDRTPIFAFRSLPDGIYEVTDRLTGEIHQVRANLGRYVGTCDCGAEPKPPFDKCQHQEAVRRFLMDRRWKSRFRKPTIN